MLQEVVSLPPVLHRTSLTTIITEDLMGVITITLVTTMVITITVVCLIFYLYFFFISILQVDVVGVQRMLQEAVFLPPVLHRTNPTTTITVDLTVVITMVITITTVITIMVITITVFVLRIEIVGEVKNVAHHLMDKGLVPTLQIIMDNNKNVVSSAFF